MSFAPGWPGTNSNMPNYGNVPDPVRDAAYDLLDALEMIVLKMEQSGNMSVAAKEHYHEAVNKGRAAINKAKGK